MTLIEYLEKKKSEKDWIFWERSILNLIRNGKIYVNDIQIKNPKYQINIGDKILKGKPNVDSIAWVVKDE
jgi:predicted rRNA methylase YqxC with S4 and FtsJ domains